MIGHRKRDTRQMYERLSMSMSGRGRTDMWDWWSQDREQPKDSPRREEQKKIEELVRQALKELTDQ